MATQVIQITGSNPDDETLELTDHGHTEACPGDTIIWQIKDPRVLSISIKDKGGSDRIWSTQPHRRGSNWMGIISLEARKLQKYKYSILWTNSDDTYEFDPLISIRSSKKESKGGSLITWLVIFMGLLSASLLYWRKKNHK